MIFYYCCIIMNNDDDNKKRSNIQQQQCRHTNKQQYLFVISIELANMVFAKGVKFDI